MRWLLCLFFLVAQITARRTLSADSLVSCMEKSQITPSFFKVTFNPDNKSLRYNMDLQTEISGKVDAHLQVYAYGFLIIEKDIDMCTIGWKQFCPLYPGQLQIDSIQHISAEYANQIPNIAYQVPDIDAVVKLVVRRHGSNEVLSCLQCSFTNGKTVSQQGIKWATAIIAGLGLMIAAVMSTFGNSNAAAFISTNAVSLFIYFQSVVVVSMQHVERVPPIASAWAENLAWSMGLIRTTFMQKIFRWYVQATGGHPTLYFLATREQILVQRAADYVKNNVKNVINRKRDLDYALTSNDNLRVLRGINRIGFNSHIEPTSIVVTGFTWFVLIGWLLAAILVFLRSAVTILMRSGAIKQSRFATFRRSFGSILKGALLKYLYIGFPQLLIFSLWEFTTRDSPAVIVLAVLFFIVAVGVTGFALWRVWALGRKSIAQYSNPAAILYGDPRVLHKYGFCYTMFDADKYWFSLVLVGQIVVKGFFIGLCQASGKTSALTFFIVDLFYTAFLIWKAPYMNKPTNILNYFVAIVTTINSFLFLFFSELFRQKASVASVMGWIFFIMNAAFSLVLLLMILFFIAMALLSKNPDSRFAPAKDDRTSFMRRNSVKDKAARQNANSRNELFALGAAAQDHSDNWENEMYKLNEVNDSSSTSEKDEKKYADMNEVHERENVSEENDDSRSDSLPKKTTMGRFKDAISRKVSGKRVNRDNNKPLRMSDTINNENIPHSESQTPINHNRVPSAYSESGFSAYTDQRPTTGKDIV